MPDQRFPSAGLPGGPDERPAVRRGIGTRLRSYFLTGLIVAGPLAVTIYISWWLINLVDAWVNPLIPARYSPETYLHISVPGYGLLVAIVAITLIGFLTATLVGRSVIGVGEGMLDHMPFVRGLYRAVKQIFQTVFRKEGGTFRRVGVLEWPAPGLWSLCFITEPPQGALAAALPANSLCVFVPCSPNPTTGYLVMVDAGKVREIELSTDEAFKLVMSMGIIQPPAPLPEDAPPLPAPAREPA
ncbi:MAG TPA: DUF502 domain-containing protein [Hyphomicrobiales bacterium]|nr:DUF502 domain-containing protein [Hyphomicrobiales bacterium]